MVATKMDLEAKKGQFVSKILIQNILKMFKQIGSKNKKNIVMQPCARD